MSIAKVGHHTHCCCEVMKLFFELLYHVLPVADLVFYVSTQHKAYVFISLLKVTCLSCVYCMTFVDIVLNNLRNIYFSNVKTGL